MRGSSASFMPTGIAFSRVNANAPTEFVPALRSNCAQVPSTIATSTSQKETAVTATAAPDAAGELAGDPVAGLVAGLAAGGLTAGALDAEADGDPPSLFEQAARIRSSEAARSSWIVRRMSALVDVAVETPP